MQTVVYKIADLDSAEEALDSAADIIRRGGLVVFPTETVYGLGGDATNPCAARKIYAAKGRPSDNPLIIHIAHPSDAEKYTYTNEVYDRLAKYFLPGPLTIVLPAKECIPKETRAGLDTVAVRCPASDIARALIERCGVPVAAPSANLSGSPSPTTARHAIDDMLGRVDAIIDGPDSDIGVESTIVSIDRDGSLTLLRPGKITVEDLSLVVDEVKIATAVTEGLREGEVVLSPGMKYRHYAPRAEVRLLDGDTQAVCDYIRSLPEKNIAVIAYDEDVPALKPLLPKENIVAFGSRSDEITQARRLFSVLRDLDKRELSLILAPTPRRDGMGLALFNRMIRAAAHKIIKL